MSNIDSEVLLDSWSKQTGILKSLMTKVTEENRSFKPSPDGLALDAQLAHINNTRAFFLSQINEPQSDRLKWFKGVEFDGTSNIEEDIDTIKAQVELSGEVVREVLADWFAEGAGRIAPYDHPVLFLQHMIWHEGWHTGLVMLALRLNGEEPTEEWEELNLWSAWRDPEI